LTVELPLESRRVEIWDDHGHKEWSLTIVQASQHEEIDSLLALGRSGKYEDALARLEEVRKRATALDQGPADAAIARMALALGRVDRAEQAFRTSIAAAKAEGRIHDVVKDSAGLFWALVHIQQRYGEARTLLEDMNRYGKTYPEGNVWLDYHVGLLASDTADVRTALEKYRSAERGARRLGLAVMRDSAADEVARVLTRIGSPAEAVTIARELPTPAEPCARATRALNIGEALMERAADHQTQSPEPEVTAALADARAATLACPDPHRRLLALVYSAEYALQVGDDAEAGRWVRAVEEAPPERDVLRSSRRADLMGRWQLHKGNPQAALASFQNEISGARAAGLLEETFRGEVGAGRSLLAMGRRRPAVGHLKEAQEAMEQMLSGIPLAEGRGNFLGGHDDGVRYLVSALVEGGAVGEALRAARWARSIELVHAARLDRLARLPMEATREWDAALGRYQRIRAEVEREAEQDWTVPRASLATLRAARQLRAEQARTTLDDAYRLLSQGGASGPDLSSPAPGEVHIVLFPGPDTWFAFAATAQGVTVRRVAASSFAAPGEAEKILASFSRELGSARRVRFFPYGAANDIDWQAVPWRGRPLLFAMEVEYVLDVGPRMVPDPGHESPQALIVSNPTGDLPAANQEADAVAGHLSGWNLTRLDGPAATRAATLAALSKARLFHYAGHAEVSGSVGLASALVLRGDARIELGDLLAAPRVPEVVVLSACDAAATVAGRPSLMGLAQAFIAAGARVAIAPTRPIRDDQARTLMALFYSLLTQSQARWSENPGQIPRESTIDLVRAAFRGAMLAFPSGRSPQTGVSEGQPRDNGVRESFRLLVPW
jgi:tetratricopeptide (TPR) repeat protein